MHAGFPLPQVDWEPTREYWAGAARGELRIPRCSRCERLSWYPLGACGACGESTLVWETMSGRAALFTWVILRHAFLPAYGDAVPFVSALVTLEEDSSIRLPTRIVDADVELLTMGQALEVSFRPLAFAGVDGEVIAPFFRPIVSSGLV